MILMTRDHQLVRNLPNILPIANRASRMDPEDPGRRRLLSDLVGVLNGNFDFLQVASTELEVDEFALTRRHQGQQALPEKSLRQRLCLQFERGEHRGRQSLDRGETERLRVG